MIDSASHSSIYRKGELMSKEVIVESFELDHTIVKAPYVRLIGEETGPKGDIISNFDIRLVQPNILFHSQRTPTGVYCNLNTSSL